MDTIRPLMGAIFRILAYRYRYNTLYDLQKIITLLVSSRTDSNRGTRADKHAQTQFSTDETKEQTSEQTQWSKQTNKRTEWHE